MEKGTKICYHHSDPDGVASAAIVALANPDCEIFVPVNYTREDKVMGLNLPHAWNRDVFIVDYSHKTEMLEKILKGDGTNKIKSLTWIDHHESAMDRLMQYWNDDSIKGIRSLEKAGCELAWDYFFPGSEVPEAIQFIGDQDIRKGAYGSRAKIFCEAMYFLIQSPTDDKWLQLLSPDADKRKAATEELESHGNVLNIAKEKRVRISFNCGVDGIFEGYKARFINAGGDVSDIGEYALNQGYDIAVMYSNRRDITAFDLRSRKGINAKEIAEKYGGGGHPNAAGFHVKRKDVARQIQNLIPFGDE